MDISTNNGSQEILFIDDSESYSTEIPSPDVESSVITIVFISLAVVLTIGLLFGLAVFIDCRHQKLVKDGKRERRLFSISLPKFFKFKRFSNEEEDTFADEDSQVVA